MRILLADDHKKLREEFRAFLRTQPGFDEVIVAENGSEAVELARKTNFDVVIMDVSMPVLNGIEATRAIRAERPDARVVALSTHCDRRIVNEMFLAGAAGFVLKDRAFEELVPAIRSVCAGGTYMSLALAEIMGMDFTGPC